jgi:hypothetical protein
MGLKLFKFMLTKIMKILGSSGRVSITFWQKKNVSKQVIRKQHIQIVARCFEIRTNGH